MKPGESVALAAAQAWVLARRERHQQEGMDPAAALDQALDEFHATFPDYPSIGTRALREG